MKKLMLVLVAAAMLAGCEGFSEFVRDFDNPDVDKTTQFQGERDQRN